MPLYQYACKHCQASLEILRRITESDSPPSLEEVAGLPALCGQDRQSHELERRIGPTSFQLVGYGWYAKGGY